MSKHSRAEDPLGAGEGVFSRGSPEVQKKRNIGQPLAYRVRPVALVLLVFFSLNIVLLAHVVPSRPLLFGYPRGAAEVGPSSNGRGLVG